MSSRSTITTRRLLSALVAILALAGCGEDDAPSPVAPAVTTYRTMSATLTITTLECLVDGDGVEGAGEFDVTVRIPFASKSWNRTLSRGQSAALDWTNEVGLGTHRADAPAPHPAVAGQEIVNYITLGNEGCRARLHYRIAFELIEFEG